VQVLKKAGIVTAAAVAMSVVAAPAFAATTAAPQDVPSVTTPSDGPSDIISFGDAYRTFIIGGGLLGAGAAALVAGAYTGIATTPAEILGSLEHHHHG
jgi:hypothetical protein